MAGVCDEPAHPLLALMPRLKGSVDVVQQGVQRGADLPNLGARVGFCRGHALGNRHRTRRQRLPRNARGGVGYGLQWAEPNANE